jgi:nucleotide-binding universal stress UspA family protein
MRQIVLTTDLSNDAGRAFPLAVDLARKYGASIALVHAVHDPDLAPMLRLDVVEEVRQAEQRLVELRRDLPADLEVSTQVLTADDVAAAIATYAAENADMIVLSTHGRTGMRRLLIGSVAEEILRHTRVPVLCVPIRDPGQLSARTTHEDMRT